ncbi:MAG: hypothetical protein HC915_07075 [Anaerolineae bacterium]|nr:hypothetical protein [Anaerolineae bacterium]
MRRSKILAKMRAGQPVKLGMLGFFVPPYVAIAAELGYDGLWLEMEHRAFEAREVQALLVLCHHYDLDCIVRPSTRERAMLYRLLEDGATGLMMPHIPDAETARQLVQAVKISAVGRSGLRRTRPGDQLHGQLWRRDDAHRGARQP